MSGKKMTMIQSTSMLLVTYRCNWIIVNPSRNIFNLSTWIPFINIQDLAVAASCLLKIEWFALDVRGALLGAMWKCHGVDNRNYIPTI